MQLQKLMGVVCFIVLVGGTVAAAPIHDAVLDRNIARINQLIAQGVNLNQWDEFGFTPLHWAVRDNQVAITRILLEAGANVNMLTGPQDSSNSTALHYAASEENDELLQLLFAYGANSSAGDNDGNTPLHIAAMLCSSVSVERIVDNDGNQRAVNRAGKAPAELMSDSCSLSVNLYNPMEIPPLADFNDTYIPTIHGLRSVGLWGGAALVSPGIYVLLSSILNENFGDDVVFADSSLDDLVFGGMIAGSTSMLLTAIETALNVDSHYLFGITLTYTIAAGAFATLSTVSALSSGLPLITLVPAIWYSGLAIAGFILQVDAATQTAHHISDDAVVVSNRDTDSSSAHANALTSSVWQPTVSFAGSQIIVRY